MRIRNVLTSAVVLGLLAAACGGSTAVESGSTGGNGGVGGAAGTSGATGTSGAAGSSGAGGTSGAAGSGAGGAGGFTGPPTKHRASATTCDNVRPVGDPMIPDGGLTPNCRSHAECIAGANGRCTGGWHDGWKCTYDQCFTDADCAATGGVCGCESGFHADNNVCLSGNCRTDADCGSAGYCSPTFGECGNYSGVVSYYCHTPQDECVDDAHCVGAGAYCMYSPAAGHWKCSNVSCAG